MRINPLRLVGSIALVVAIAACQSAAKPAAAGKAIVRAHGGGAANWLAVTFQPLGEAHRVDIEKVNHADPARYGNERQVVLMPGHYEISVKCIFIVDMHQYFSVGSLDVDVVADHIYLIDAGMSPRPDVCVARVSDTTNGPH
jgi:hypothetical protein